MDCYTSSTHGHIVSYLDKKQLSKRIQVKCDITIGGYRADNRPIYLTPLISVSFSSTLNPSAYV